MLGEKASSATPQEKCADEDSENDIKYRFIAVSQNSSKAPSVGHARKTTPEGNHLEEATDGALIIRRLNQSDIMHAPERERKRHAWIKCKLDCSHDPRLRLL